MAGEQSIAGRYRVLAELGQGGMARVYRVVDAANGCELALKQLSPQSHPERALEATRLFEREFSTLAQLSHPRVIAVYDYGLDAAGPFYTMELLDGGDLRERTPLAWRNACELIFDVASSLALLHARRLVHRDVSPRNVRCTRDGHAKLIDFGAMVEMGAGAKLVGTPPFVAPECVQGDALDARSDLFSLGATLYYALTGRLAFPAQDFAQLRELWSRKPAPPSAMAPDVPPALDRLVMSLISLEPALRPRSSFEVMQRLAALAGIEREEPLGVSGSYLVAPMLVGRAQPSAAVNERLQGLARGRGRGLVIAGAPGLGRSRMLDASVLAAKLSGARVLRTAVAAGSGEFGLAESLVAGVFHTEREVALAAARSANQLDTLVTDGALRSFARPARERAGLSRAIAKWFVALSKLQPLVIAVDDVERADEGSLALLAGLAERARSAPLLMLCSAATGEAALPAGVEVLRSRCVTLELQALDLPETEQLLCSLFGDVPQLALLSQRIDAIAHGNPRQIMALAQHLVDRQAIRYDAGGWSLPQQLTAADLPASADDALRARLRALPPLALELAQLHALAPNDALSRADHAALCPEAEPSALRAALDALLSQRVLCASESGYTLAQRTAAEVLSEELEPQRRADYHRRLAAWCALGNGADFEEARHWLAAGEHGRGLDRLIATLREFQTRGELQEQARATANEAAATMERALELAIAMPRPLREQHDLRQWLLMLSVAKDDALYWASAPAWLERLELDSGLTEYRALRAEVPDAGQRLMRALQAAAERFNATPEAERVYPPDQAIRLLVHYVVVSIAIGARSLDSKLLLSLPEVLEPFAPLSPLVAAIWQNALATCDSSCRRQSESAHKRWVDVYERLGTVESPDPQLVLAIRNAVAYGVGVLEASLGQQSALKWAEILDSDPMQKVSAVVLRKLLRLQQGDLEGAERFRKQAELLELEASSRQMFQNLLQVELLVHAAAWDLTGVKQIGERIEGLAERHAGWRPLRWLARGHYQRLRGDLDAAERAYESCLAICTPDANDPSREIIAWPQASAGYVETLIALGRADAAKSFAEHTLREAEARGMGVSLQEVVRALALAEGKLGDFAGAIARLERLIEKLLELGVSGLSLGASYEARARVAIWAGDRAAVERYGALTAQQYRHGRGSSLGARYERLMEEARSAGVVVLPALSPYESTMFGTTDLASRGATRATVLTVLSGTDDAAERSQRALQLLCQARGAPAGHLYLARSGGLDLVASSGVSAPDDKLKQHVSAFWSRQESEDFEPDTAMASESGVAWWTDVSGNAFSPVLVSGRVNGELVHAGVAVLVAGEDANEQGTSMEVVEEIGSFLVRAS